MFRSSKILQEVEKVGVFFYDVGDNVYHTLSKEYFLERSRKPPPDPSVIGFYFVPVSY